MSPDARPLRSGERPLDDQQVSAARSVDDLAAGTRVGAVDDLAATLGADPDGEGLDEMRDRVKARPDISDLDPVARLVLLDPEGALDQVVVAPGPDDLPEGLLRSRRRDQPRPGGLIGPLPDVHRDRLLLRRVDQRVGVRDEVEEVIRVQVGDEDAVDLGVVDALPELAEDAVPAIEQDLRRVRLEEVSTASPPGVLPGRTLAEHGELHDRPMSPARTLNGLVHGFAVKTGCASPSAAAHPRIKAATPPLQVARPGGRFGPEAAAPAAGAGPGPRGCRAGRWGRASRVRGRRVRGAGRSSRHTSLQHCALELRPSCPILSRRAAAPYPAAGIVYFG